MIYIEKWIGFMFYSDRIEKLVFIPLGVDKKG